MVKHGGGVGVFSHRVLTAEQKQIPSGKDSKKGKDKVHKGPGGMTRPIQPLSFIMAKWRIILCNPRFRECVFAYPGSRERSTEATSFKASCHSGI